MKSCESESALPRVNISNYRQGSNPFSIWGPRAIPDTELVFIHDGAFSLELEGETVQAKENELLVIFPGERHTLRNAEESGIISCIHCDFPESSGRRLARVRIAADPELADGFRRCAEAFLHPAPFRDELLQAILSEILIRIRSLGTLVETNRPSDRVQEMVRYIRDHLDELVTRSTLAEKFHASPQHINYLFKTELGTSPTRLLHSERAKKAFLLIQNERISVKEAAFRTGFCDPYHFSKVFKKVYGFPPGRIRRFFSPQ